jgi:hypothetical protein
MDWDCEGQTWEDTHVYYLQERAETFESNGKSSGYFGLVSDRQCRGWREAEAQQQTRFGSHWVVQRVKRPNKRKYETTQSPYDPKWGLTMSGRANKFWPFRTAMPPRIGSAAPNRWAAEPEGVLRPYGLRPYEKQLALASMQVAPRLSDDPYALQRLRDLRTHIAERARHSGSAFQDTEGKPLPHAHAIQMVYRELEKAERVGDRHRIWAALKELERLRKGDLRSYVNREARRDLYPSAEFARGIRWAEIDGIEKHRRHEQLRWQIDNPPGDYRNDSRPDWLKDNARAPYRKDVQALRYRGRDNQMAVDEGFGFENVDIVRRRERKGLPPLRERRKPGPKPKHGHTMTIAERVSKCRARKAAST